MKSVKGRLKSKVRKTAQKYPAPARLIRNALHPRACHVYCVGAPKTGTESVANIYKPAFRSRHEPLGSQTINMLEARWEGRVHSDDVSRWLRGRDAVLWLECEAFHATAWFTDLLAAEFENAKFILPVRDCYSWLDSVINQHLNTQVSPPFKKLRDLYHVSPYEVEDQVLAEKGLYSLEGYLSYWAKHNAFVLDAVPADRLLVIPTRGLSDLVDEIADFSGVAASQLNRERSHSHKSPKKHDILSHIDRNLILERIEQICGPTISRLSSYQHLANQNLIGS